MSNKRKVHSKSYKSGIIKEDIEKSKLEKQIKDLQEEVFVLQPERDILEKAAELLKKEMSISPDLLNNKEKAILIDALGTKYEIKVLLKSLCMAKSSYFYYKKVFKKEDKYISIRDSVHKIFNESGNTYGYRRIYASLKKENIILTKMK